ncbi:haloalkane dehalogenase [Nocardia sp. NPDC050718]|uniref:haloalkane dehalogenase n=1 Tax=Nocardia sp. NPDC050718 TaxID=3155788 RepID=UPI0033D8ADD2
MSAAAGSARPTGGRIIQRKEPAMPTVDVIDSFISYSDAGADTRPVVFLHGNPTSSYLWRDVLPVVREQARCLAPDLIGMGASGKPEIAYRLDDHARYLDAWFDALDLTDPILVGHDWGGTLAMDFAARHPGRVAGIAVIETFLRPLRWSDLPARSAEMFRLFRSPAGEQAVLAENKFIEYNLPTLVPALTEADLDAYRAPYPTPASRAPMLAWAREFPLDGEPADVAARVDAYGAWMAASAGVPKLLMTVEPAVGLGGAEVIAWATATFADLEVESVGQGSHHAPEDQPVAIAKSVAGWLDRHGLLA